MSHISEIKSKLKAWVKPKSHYIPITFAGLSAKTIHEPKGATLIISPWNYPFYLAIYPLLYAIAAGCTVVLKPSELTPHTSVFIKLLCDTCLSLEDCRVLQGGVEETTYLLEKKWDHIFFTGSPQVGKIVMKAASQHLTSVSLELGGKSPCIIDETANLKTSAQKLLWGKFINAGQTCIAPDYVLIHKSKEQELLKYLKEELSVMYGEDMEKSDSLARIISQKHTQRLGQMISDSISEGARLEIGGKYDVDTNYVEPTILSGVTPEMSVMKEEIFGPVLPILSYSGNEEAISIIEKFDKPLSFYVCTKSKKTEAFFKERTSSGGMVINDFIMGAAIPTVPFGGVNNSGMGKAYGFHGFLEFSNEKPVVKRNYMALKFIYPPYTEQKEKILNLLKRFV